MRITGAQVYTENHRFEQKTIEITGERITGLSAEKTPAADGRRSEEYAAEEYAAEGLYVIPGLVDIHFHGAAGSDFCSASAEELKKLAEYEAKNGILAICPATMTYGEKQLEKIAETARMFVKGQEKQNAAELVGIRLEGPFLHPQKLGAQNPEGIHPPDIAMLRRLQEKSGGLIRMVDVAPELEDSLEFIRECSRSVSISLAHTTADYETAVRAFSLGAKQLTHLYNAMPGIHHRQPGPVIAGWEQNAAVELIADGVHVHPAMVRFTFQMFGARRVILISDSMEATGCPDGEYQLGGQTVFVSGARAVLKEQPAVIAGSVTNLMECMKRTVLDMQVPLEQAIRAATENPARAIGIENEYGSVAPGKYANLVLLNRKLELVDIINKGKLL